MVDLARAAAQIDGRDLAAGLDALLAVWRDHPSAPLATRIERLTTIMLPALGPLPGKNAAQQHDAWLLLAGAGRAVDVPVLAEHLDRPPGTRIRARLTWLASRPSDPRWTPYLVRMFGRRWSIESRTDARICGQVFKLLCAMADPRAPGMLRALKIETRGYWARDIDEWLARIDKAVGAAPTASPDAFEALDAALARAQSRPAPGLADLHRAGMQTEAQVRAMVYDAPDDLDTRRVYADWLEQTATPRAEFLRLQLKRIDGRLLKREEKREKALLSRHGLGWLGALAPFVGDVDWRAGFPVGADIKFRGPKARDRALADPAWRTLTEATCADPVALDHPNLAGLRQIGRTSPFVGTEERVTPVGASVLNAMQSAARVERLVASADDLSEIDFEAFSGLRALEIQHLNQVGFGPTAVQRYIECVRRLSLDQLTFWRVDVRLWSQMIVLFEGVERFEICGSWNFRCALERVDGAWRMEAVWPWAHACHDFSALVTCVRRFDPAQVTIQTPGYNHPAATLTQWASALGERAVELPKARRSRARRAGR